MDRHRRMTVMSVLCRRGQPVGVTPFTSPQRPLMRWANRLGLVFGIACFLFCASKANAQTVANCPVIPVNDNIVRAAPTVIRSSDTLDTNQIIQFFGDSMNSAQRQVAAMGWAIADTAVTSPQNPPAFSATNGNCLTVSSATATTAKVLLPASGAHTGNFGPGLGLYAVQLGNSSGSSLVRFINRAEPWWVLGSVNDTSGSIFPANQGGTADKLIPGQPFRVFGRNLFASAQMQGWLQGNGVTCPLAYQLSSSNNWAASFQLPLSCGLNPGSYTLFIHNGLGGSFGFGNTLSVTVGVIPPAWSSAIYNVKAANYGAVGDGQHDDTAAFQAALADAAAGGTVAIPPGTYLISSKLSIPQYSILKGTGTDQTQAVLVSSENGLTSVLAGNGNFNVQNLTIQTSTAHRVITCPDNAALYNGYGLAAPYPSPCSNVLVDHVTINHNTPLSAFQGTDVGNGSLHTYGSDITIQNSTITAQGTAPTLLYGSHHVVVNGNTLFDGNSDADGFFDADEVTYENNSHSATPGTLGNAIYVEGESHYIYVANNNIQNSLGTDGEGFVSGDAPYLPDRLGPPTSSYAGTNPTSDPATVTFANAGWQINQLASGEAIYVISGKGAFQRNYVVSNTGDTLYLKTLWQIPLDGTSVVEVVKDHSEGIFYNNTFTNVSVSVQLYCQSYGFVVDHNASTASGPPYCVTWNEAEAIVAGAAQSTGGAYTVRSLPGTTYGPVNMIYDDYTAPGGKPLFAAGQIFGAPRNDITGFVGTKFTISQAYAVGQLGRMCLAGNSGTHIVKLVSPNGVDVSGGSISVSMAGCTPGKYVYASFPAAINLNAASSYYLVSQEAAGGDSWYDSTEMTPFVGFNLCYFNQFTNNRATGSLDSSNPNKAGASASFGANTSVLGVVLEPATMSSPSPPLGYIPPAVGNEIRNNTLTAVTQGTGQGSPIIGGVYNIFTPSYACGPVLLPDGAVTDTLVEANTSSGSNPPILFWNLFGNTVLHNNVYQGTAEDFSFTNCAPSVVISSPAGGATLSGSVLLSATAQAQASSNIAAVQFQVDGTSVLTAVQTPPYQVTLDSTTLLNGLHFLSAVATDSLGRSVQAPTVEITASNSTVTIPVSNSNALLTSFSTGNTRNNYSGYVGLQFTTGAAISVASLGRVFVSGNTATHTVKLVLASSGADVSGASVSVAMSGGTPGTFNYALLSSPIVLAANTSYYLLSQETAGGDQWYDIAPVSVNAGAAVINGPVYSTNSQYVFVGGASGDSYVPANLLYTTAPANSAVTVSVGSPASGASVSGTITLSAAAAGANGASITSVQFQVDGVNVASALTASPYNLSYDTSALSNGSHTVTATAIDSSNNRATSAGVLFSVSNGGAVSSTAFVTGRLGSPPLRNNFSGSVGMQITVGSAPLVVQSLGRIFVAGNTAAHTVKFVSVATGQDVAGSSVSISGGNAGQFSYVSLASPVTLSANTSYDLVSTEVNGGDQWYDLGPVTTTAAGSVVGPVYLDGTGHYVTASGLSGDSYVPLSFQYGQAANTLSATITSPQNGASLSGNNVAVAVSTTGAVTSLQLQVDGVNQGGPVVASPIALDTTTLSNGQHTLTVLASGSGSNALSPGVTITVNNNGGTSSGTSTPFITAEPASSLRNNYSGFVGLSLRVGSTAVVVSSLGRFVAPGNSGTHLLKLVDSNGGDLPGGSVSISLAAAAPGTFQYASLPNGPFTLQANTTYYLVSQETTGGDQWYDYAPVQTSVVATVIGPAYTDGANRYVTAGGLGGNSYVPVSFLYGSTSNTLSVTITSPQNGALLSGKNTLVSASASGSVSTFQLQVDGVPTGNPVAASPITLDTTALTNGTHTLTVVVSGNSASAVSAGVSVTVNNGGGSATTSFTTSQTASALRNNYTGFVGMAIQVGPAPISVTSLGRYVVPGNGGMHTLKLVQANGSDVPGGSVTVTIAGATAGQYAYFALSNAVTLSANTTYYLVSQETAGGDQWYDVEPIATTAVAQVTGPVYVDGQGRYVAIAGLAGDSYVPLSFQYQ